MSELEGEMTASRLAQLREKASTEGLTPTEGKDLSDFLGELLEELVRIVKLMDKLDELAVNAVLHADQLMIQSDSARAAGDESRARTYRDSAGILTGFGKLLTKVLQDRTRRNDGG